MRNFIISAVIRSLALYNRNNIVLICLGYNGTHPWNKPGELFEDHPVWGMRGGCTLLGTFIVPFAFIAGKYNINFLLYKGGKINKSEL